MKPKEFSFKDLSKGQLDALKELYIDSRLNSMSIEELRRFTKEVLSLQVMGTVGAEEEKEVWKEMKQHFEDDFPAKVKEVIKAKGAQEVLLEQEEDDFKKRLELLEKRKIESPQKKLDMWE